MYGRNQFTSQRQPGIGLRMLDSMTGFVSSHSCGRYAVIMVDLRTEIDGLFIGL